MSNLNEILSDSSSKSKEKIIVYYLAAPEDENTCKAIYKHLSTIQFNAPLPIEMLDDFNIAAGEEIGVHKAKISEADIVLAFVSVDFLNNKECYERLKTVITNHNNRKTILLPILARNCMWKATPFADLPLLPKNQQPLNNRQYWNSEDDALTNVVDEIYKAINDFTKDSHAKSPAQHSERTVSLDVNWRGKYLWKVFWKRCAAYILDVFIIILPVIIALYLISDTSFSEEAEELSLSFYFVYTAILILISSLFDASRWRGTPGKYIMKLQITDDFGNPIQFGKAVIRNLIKYFLFVFLSAIDTSGVIVLLFWIAQIVCFIIFKKFIHDYLSHTVIGERIKEDIHVPAMQQALGSATGNAYPENKAARLSGYQKQSSPKRLVLTTVSITAGVFIAAYLLLKLLASSDPQPNIPGLAVNDTSTVPYTTNQLLPEPAQTNAEVETNSEAEITEDQQASLISAIRFADAIEIEAQRTLNSDVLTRAYSGEALRSARAHIESLISEGNVIDSKLEDQQFLSFKIMSDGERAEVKLIETWSGTIYSLATEQCIGKMPSHEVPQTMYLKQNNEGWIVDAIIFDLSTEPQIVPCY